MQFGQHVEPNSWMNCLNEIMIMMLHISEPRLGFLSILLYIAGSLLFSCSPVSPY